MKRRATITALAAAGALVVASGLAVGLRNPASAATVTLPDMQIMVPVNNISISTVSGVRQLQFTHDSADMGSGPFEIDPTFNQATGISSFVQQLYSSPSPGVWQKDHTVPVVLPSGNAPNGKPWGTYENTTDMVFPMTLFTLNQVNADGTPGAQVAVSPKSDYCLTGDTYIGGVPNTPNSTSPMQSNCSDPTKPLGWSVGWADQYDQTDNGQPIPLTGIPDGTYVLVATIDPFHVLQESDPANNSVYTTLQIAGSSVTVVSQGPGPNPVPTPTPTPTTTSPTPTPTTTSPSPTPTTTSPAPTPTTTSPAPTPTVTTPSPTPTPTPTVMTCFVQTNLQAVHGRGSLTTAAFHTAAAGETLLAFVSADGPNAAGGQTSTVSGAGLTWRMLRRVNNRPGDAEIWSATAPAVLTAATVKSTLKSTGYDQDLTVVAYEGVKGTGAVAGAYAASGAPSVTLTTAGATSLVFGVGHDYDNAIPRTLPAGQVFLDQWVDNGVGDTAWTQYTSTPTGAAGQTVTVRDTAPVSDQWDIAAVELIGSGS